MWIRELFHTEKPIIAMCHLQAMPGDPNYDFSKGMKWVVQKAKEDLIALQEGGVNGVLFSNEFSLPYLTDVKAETIAAMARVIGELMPLIKVPYGVDVLWDPIKTYDLAAAVDAKFVREIFSGVYASDFGLWNTNYGEVVRHKMRVGAQGVKAFFNILPEAARYLADRDLSSIAKSTNFNMLPDAFCVSGLTAGVATDINAIISVKKVVENTPVFLNTGVTIHNIEEQLSLADGAIVGTAFKREGKFMNEVDKSRVIEFMSIARKIQNQR